MSVSMLYVEENARVNNHYTIDGRDAILQSRAYLPSVFE